MPTKPTEKKEEPTNIITGYLHNNTKYLREALTKAKGINEVIFGPEPEDEDALLREPLSIREEITIQTGMINEIIKILDSIGTKL